MIFYQKYLDEFDLRRLSNVIEIFNYNFLN
jgi:hypothetical protein